MFKCSESQEHSTATMNLVLGRRRHPDGQQFGAGQEEGSDRAPGVSPSRRLPRLSPKYQNIFPLRFVVLTSSSEALNTALLVLLPSDLLSLKVSHPDTVPSQNYETQILTKCD